MYRVSSQVLEARIVVFLHIDDHRLVRRHTVGEELPALLVK